jgi:ubiquinone/menaquinone biosynthesis C-methylase UbiE
VVREWYEIGEKYAENSRHEIAPLFTATPSLNLPEWHLGETEGHYNLPVADGNPGVYLCLDASQQVRDPLGRRCPLEICDLLGPGNELIHVKFAARSAPLSRLFFQGLNSALNFIYGPADVREQFTNDVSKRGRTLPADFMPQKVVFAILLDKGKHLTLDTLPLSRKPASPTPPVSRLRAVPNWSRTRVGTRRTMDGKVFDDVAAEYDRHRPTYPDELVDQACRVAGLRSGDEVLEVGCGSGQLTRSLVVRGLRVTAVEPGANLVALARGKVDGAVEFVNARFEDAPLPRERFRAVFSASAFHWVDPKVGWRKAADVLVPGGTLALVQYCGVEEPRSKPDQDALLAAMSRVAPEIAATWPAYRDIDAMLAGIEQRRSNISQVWAWLGSYDIAQDDAGHLFGDVEVVLEPKLVEHTAAQLNAVVGTFSAYARLSPDQRHALACEYEAIYQQLGRPVRSSTATVLVAARRIDD